MYFKLRMSFTKKLCLVMGRVTPTTLVSWKASLPITALRTCPEIITRGVESNIASAKPVTQLVAPGPDVTITTPAFPVTRAKPSAA